MWCVGGIGGVVGMVQSCRLELCLLQINGNIFLERFGSARDGLGLVLWGWGRKVVPLSRMGYR